MPANPTRERRRSSSLQAACYDANVVPQLCDPSGWNLLSGAVLGGEILSRKSLSSGNQLRAGQVEAGDEAQQRARRRISCSGLDLPDASLRNPCPQRDGLLGELKLLSPFPQGDAERAEEADRIWHRATLIGSRDVCNVIYVVHRAPDRGAMALRCVAVHTGS